MVKQGGSLRIRRRNIRRSLFALGLIFVSVFTFTLLKNINKSEIVEAYSLANFDPGFIISDYVMGDYTSMTEAEIQAFLTKKNSCSNTNREYYDYLSKNTKYKWHWKDDHFVCLSEELFGEGEIIGEGETAAHIIWQAAQDFQINPKVLIVLLEKETSLVTDKIPNDGDYRKATGYGCPDTAACSEKYYGFKNQIRNAAYLFHIVLTGGWTNFPLGVNYIQYNPNRDCGGSEVNIRSLATSALYRYTPYQPNQGAIAAGYGTTTCGAYGNRNFYLYFGDWFGDPTYESWKALEMPRYLIDKKTNEATYFSYQRTKDGQTCLGTSDKVEDCVMLSDLKEADWPKQAMLYKRNMVAYKDTNFINPVTNAVVKAVKKGEKFLFDGKYIIAGGKQCLAAANTEGCILEENLSEDWIDMEVVREMAAVKDTYKVQPITNEKNYNIKVTEGLVRKFVQKIKKGNEWCLRTEFDLEHGINTCLLQSELRETWSFFATPQNYTVMADTKKIHVRSLAEDIVVAKGTNRNFTSTQYSFGKNEWCYRTEYDTARNTDNCILESMLNVKPEPAVEETPATPVQNNTTNTGTTNITSNTDTTNAGVTNTTTTPEASKNDTAQTPTTTDTTK